MFGLFESETVVSVSTSFSRVIEDRLLPDSVKTGTIKGIFSGDQLVENIMEDLVSSIGAKGERLYRYGKDKYMYGAPTSKIYRSASTIQITESVLSALIGHEVSATYSYYAPLNRQHYGWQRLYDTYGYSPVSNELTVLSGQKGVPVYLEDMQVCIAQDKMNLLSAAGYAQWGDAATSGYTPLRPYSGASRAHTPICFDPSVSADFIRVTAIWKSGTTIQREVFTFPVLVPAEGAEFIQTRFSYKTESHRTSEWQLLETGQYGWVEVIHYADNVGYFTYQVGSEVHPELDALYSTAYDDLGSFFPFGYFRFNKQPTSTDPASAEYKAQTKFMKYLNLGYEDINEAINSNPQIGDVDSAMLMLVVPVLPTSQVEKRYLFDFFKRLYVQSGAIALPETGSSSSNVLYNLIRTHNRNTRNDLISLVIRDARFETSLGMSGIYRRVVPGVIGKVGSYACDSSTISHNYSGVQTHNVMGSTLEGGPITVYWTITEPVYFYRKQITETLYEEISVNNLRATYKVSGSHTTANKMIPLDHSITEEYSLPDREELYARSLHYVFNSKQETELEWYEQEWFGELLIVIAIVWTFFSMGSDGGSALGAAIAAGTATAIDIAIAIAIMALEYIALKLVVKLFVKLLGPEFALLVAVVAAAYSMYTAYGTPGGMQGAPWAKDLLSVSNSLISEVSAGYQKELQGLREESDEFNLFAKTKMDELEKVREEMEGSHLLSPFILFGESPTNYFNRTVHVGNIGVQGIEAISNYVGISLELPKPSQTISFDQPLWG